MRKILTSIKVNFLCAIAAFWWFLWFDQIFEIFGPFDETKKKHLKLTELLVK